LATKELAVALRQRAVSHFLFTMACFTKNNMTVVTHQLFFSVSPIEDITEAPPF
jgi:hypothetical protein